MAKKHWDIKEIIVIIFVLLGGVAFTATSLCVYYLVDPPNTAGLAVICVADFIYTVFITCIMCKYRLRWKKWFLKGLLMAVGYVVAFIVASCLLLGIYGSFEIATNNIVGIVFYAIFTAPCILIVGPLIILALTYA